MDRNRASSRRRVAVAAATGVACAFALVITPASAADDSDGALPKLRGKVGPDATISISDNEVPAGTYRLIVNDKASFHNFHISGDGVDEETAVSFVGRVRWTVTLSEGTYNIRCDPHRSTMKTKLVVT